MSFPGSDPTKSFYQAHSQWKTMHDQLSISVAQYLDACVALEALTQPSLWLNQPGLEQALLELGNCVQPTLINEERLTIARQTLNKGRNRSEQLAPINVLPPEILAHIFDLSKCHCTRDPIWFKGLPVDKDLSPFMNVCTYWRQVALNTPKLWTHIDIHALTGDMLCEGFAQYTRKHLERAQGSMLHIHIVEEDYLSIEDLGDAAVLLALHLEQIKSFDIDTPYYIPRLLSSCFFFDVLPGVVESLSLSAYRANDPSPRDLQDAATCWNSQPPPEHIENIFASLKELDIYSAFVIDWTSAAFRCLVDLRLDSLASAGGPTVHQIADILSASPQLRMLQLARMTIRETDAYRGPPIKLEYLEELNLIRLHPRNLPVLLPLLALGSQPLSLSIRLQGVVRIELVESLLRRLNLRKFFVDVGSDQHAWLPRIFFSTPNLETLMIRHLELLANIFITAESSPSILCPSLKELHLLHSTFRRQGLFGILASQQPEKLRLWRCSERGFGAEILTQWSGSEWLQERSTGIQDFQNLDMYEPNPALQWDFSRYR